MTRFAFLLCLLISGFASAEQSGSYTLECMNVNQEQGEELKKVGVWFYDDTEEAYLLAFNRVHQYFNFTRKADLGEDASSYSYVFESRFLKSAPPAHTLKIANKANADGRYYGVWTSYTEGGAIKKEFSCTVR